jgi:hypothetical protein
MARREVRIPHRHRDGLVAQQFLHRPEIPPGAVPSAFGTPAIVVLIRGRGEASLPRHVLERRTALRRERISMLEQARQLRSG